MQQENRNYGRDQNIFNQPGTVIVNPQAERLRDPVQRKLLEVVRGEVSDRLAQSLHRVVGASLINLTKESQPGQVRSPWQMELWQEQQPPQRLPPETTIAQVFDQAEVERKLLILGEPGSGKTTTMLELARELVQRAEAAVDQPIPVLLNLSSWKPPQDGKQDLFLPWLLAELKAKYGIRQDLSKTWLATSQLLPLLDGLDEVAPQHQEACATAINQWLTVDVEQRPMGLVVCCRIKEYEEVVRKRLYLEGAIALLPLTDDQIEIYLNQFGLEQVWHSAQTSGTLQDLLSKPLFLSVFGFVASQKQFDVAEWQHRTAEVAQREYLLDQYWDAAMMRKLVSVQEREKGIQSKNYGKRTPPKQKALRRALVFAAKAMEQESLTELLIERIQPSWLISKQQRWIYQLIVGFTTGLILGFFFGLTFGLYGALVSGLEYGYFIGILSGITFSLLFSFISAFTCIFIGNQNSKLNSIPIIDFIELKSFNSLSLELLKKALKEKDPALINWIMIGLISYSLIGLLAGSAIQLKMLYWQFQGLIAGLISGVLIAFMGRTTYFWISRLIRELQVDIKSRPKPNQGIKNSWRNIAILSLIFLITVFIPTFFIAPKIPFGGFNANFTVSNTFVFSTILFFSLYSLLGGETVQKHTILRLIMWWNRYAPFRYDRLLNYATERLLLQRIGGRYRFMHKLLQEHFAAMDLDN